MADDSVPTSWPGGPTFSQRLFSEEVAIANTNAGEPVEQREEAYVFSNGRKFFRPDNER